MPRTITLACFFVLCLQSCNQRSGPATNTDTTGPRSENAALPPAGRQSLTIEPGFTIPVYENFEGLAPIFNRSGDTTYVINFWATWCKPCIEELPFFEKLQDSFAPRKVRVILVSLDFKRDLEKNLAPFLRERQLKSEVMVLLDGNYNNWIDRVDPSWGGAIPATLVYNSRGRKFHEQQFANYEELENLLISLF